MTSAASRFAALRCSDCGRDTPASLDGVCDCGGLRFAAYDLDATPPMPAGGGLWSWSVILPACDALSAGEGEPPPATIEIGEAIYADESALPTGTFKARGAAVGVAMARALGAAGVVLPTAGNAGAAWAAYCRAAGLPCAVVVSEDAPAFAVDEARACGAEVEVARGSIADAGVRAAEIASRRGWHHAATFREPWRVEGKKTALCELVAALGRLPDAAVIPVGGGVGAIAWHKAATEMRALGWANGSLRVYAAQAAGCAPVVQAVERGASDVDPWPSPRTAAAGIRIASPLAGRHVLRAVRESGGGAVACGEDEMVRARAMLSAHLRIDVALEAAAAWAGYERLRAAGAFADGETVVVYGTGGRPLGS